jgi:hypothetical protein
MSVNEHQPGDFIPYPTNRVVGTITDAKDARAALDSLLNAGFQPSESTSFTAKRICTDWIQRARSMGSSRSSSGL